MLAHFGHKLTIRHFIGSFQFDGDATKFPGFDVLVELALGLPRSYTGLTFSARGPFGP